MNTTILRCPFCGTPLHRENSSLLCERPRPHCFDIARSGYVTLTRASGNAGDDKDMVRARTAFLEKDYYKPFADAVCATVGDAHTVIDAGCGEGYYANRIAAMGTDVYGFDLSKSACDHAAKRAKQAGVSAMYGVASLFELPAADRSADAIVNLFAPVAEKEFARVLKEDGRLIIGAAGKRHLYELKQAVYDTAYENEGRRDLPEGFALERQENVTFRFTCVGDDLKHLFGMTPYAFRTSPSDAARLDRLEQLDITADFDIFIYRLNKGV